MNAKEDINKERQVRKMRNLVFAILTILMLALIGFIIFLPVVIDAYGMDTMEVRDQNRLDVAGEQEGMHLVGGMDSIDPECQRIFLHENARILMKTVRSL